MGVGQIFLNLKHMREIWTCTVVTKKALRLGQALIHFKIFTINRAKTCRSTKPVFVYSQVKMSS